MGNCTESCIQSNARKDLEDAGYSPEDIEEILADFNRRRSHGGQSSKPHTGGTGNCSFFHV